MITDSFSLSTKTCHALKMTKSILKDMVRPFFVSQVWKMLLCLGLVLVVPLSYKVWDHNHGYCN